MIDRIIEFFTPIFADWGYLIVGLATLLENSLGLGLIVPGETLLLLGGFFAGMGDLDPVLLIVVAIVGGVAGDNVGYLIGRRAGRPFIARHGHRFFIREERLVAAEAFYARHGGTTVFVGRFVPVVRSFGALLAGVSHMRYVRFFVYDLAGATIWAIAHVLLGFFVGDQYPRFQEYIDQAGWGLFAVLVLIAAFIWWRKRRRASVVPGPGVKREAAEVEIKEGGADADHGSERPAKETSDGDRRLPEVRGGGGGQ